jgi:hypothetical protein
VSKPCGGTTPVSWSESFHPEKVPVGSRARRSVWKRLRLLVGIGLVLVLADVPCLSLFIAQLGLHFDEPGRPALLPLFRDWCGDGRHLRRVVGSSGRYVIDGLPLLSPKSDGIRGPSQLLILFFIGQRFICIVDKWSLSCPRSRRVAGVA